MIDRDTKKTRFSDFLSGEYARDYINQELPYDEQIERAAARIREADYVLLGAGAGMSTAAGAEYGGKFFEEKTLPSSRRSMARDRICRICTRQASIPSRIRRANGGCGHTWPCWPESIWT